MKPPTTKVKVSVTFKDGVLDPEAAAIQRSLRDLGFENVNKVKRVRVIEVELDAADEREAREQAQAMCERLLVNPVIESYAIQIEG